MSARAGTAGARATRGARPTRRTRGVLVALSAVALGLFVVLCLLVHAGRFVTADVRARHWFWPSGHWGTTQRLEDVVVELCQPTVMAIVLAVVAARTARRRRDATPVLAALALIAVAIGAVVVVKHVLAVPDVHGSTAHLGGSFPSGHMVGVICFGGGIVLLRRTRPTWRAWTVVAALATVVAACLLLTSVHWVTDIVGGVLLATSLTAAAATAPWWASSRGPHGVAPSPRDRTRSSTARRRA